MPYRGRDKSVIMFTVLNGRGALIDWLPVVTGVGGIALGAAATELHAIMQDVRDGRRALRAVLFMLLELRHEVRRRDPREIASVLTQYLAHRLPGFDQAAMNSPDAQEFVLR